MILEIKKKIKRTYAPFCKAKALACDGVCCCCCCKPGQHQTMMVTEAYNYKLVYNRVEVADVLVADKPTFVVLLLVFLTD